MRGYKQCFKAATCVECAICDSSREGLICRMAWYVVDGDITLTLAIKKSGLSEEDIMPCINALMIRFTPEDFTQDGDWKAGQLLS